MCFHNSINTDKQSLEKKYKAKLKGEQKPIFHANAFEYQKWPIIPNNSEFIEQMNWGLIPSWADSPSKIQDIRSKTLNARIETISEKPSFKNAKKCIVPSTGFFEWQEVGNTKIPYFIFVPEMPIFSMAGLFDSHVNTQGKLVNTFSILTTEANSLMAEIHNTKKRMPVLLDQKQEQLWLNDELTAEELYVPFDSKKMKAYTIGNTISSKNHNSKEVNAPKVIQVSEQLNLF